MFNMHMGRLITLATEKEEPETLRNEYGRHEIFLRILKWPS